MHGSSVQGTTKRSEYCTHTGRLPPSPPPFLLLFMYILSLTRRPHLHPHSHPTLSCPTLLAQATKTLTKEAKRVRTFLLQQAIRKSKAAALRGKGTKANDSSDGDAGGGSHVGGSGDGASRSLEQSQQGSAGIEVVDEKSSTKTAAETAAAATAGGTVAAVAGAGEDKRACSDRDPAGGAAKGERGASSSSPASEEVLLIKVMGAHSLG